MITEWLTYLTTPCPRHLREMGYLRQSIGVRSHFRRCRRAWAPHIDNCRRLILDAADACSRRRRAVILGSGLLCDVPLEELAARFEEVVLVDIVHLRPARRRAGAFANVRVVERDVTGVVEQVFGGELPQPALGNLPDEDVDLMVSANLLSQLPLLPREHLERRGVEGIDDFASAVVQSHLTDLAAFPGVACLITDVEHLVCDGGDVVESRDALFGVRLPYRGREWIWNIAPRPEAGRRRDLLHRVLGVVDIRQAYARYASDRRNTTRAAP